MNEKQKISTFCIHPCDTANSLHDEYIYLFYPGDLSVSTHCFSELTDSDSNNTTDSGGIKNSDVFRQLLNQETLIRMSIGKNAHGLMKDMVTLKQTLLSSESEISTLKRTMTELKKELEKLKKENERISRENMVYKENISDIYEDISRITKTQQKLEEDIDKRKREFENNTTEILANINTEVRYFKMTVLNMNEKVLNDLEKIPEIINEQYNSISMSLNRTLEYYNTAFTAESKKLFIAISDVEKTQTNLVSSVTDGMNTSISGLQSEVKQYQLDLLKLSSTVSSLQVSQMNMSRNGCGKNSQIGFTTGITSSNSGFTGSKIVFRKVLYNEGQSYYSTTGIFTSHVEGHFVFFTTCHSKTQNLQTNIMLNGVAKVRSEAFNTGDATYQTGANMILLKLQRGDRVWIARTSGTGYYTESVPIMTFSGFML
ncbi:uncharacterized protein LOC134281185 [Saccostrea cucullata]|uniref:uncharacterized protein LOC134281185 n=1 Tax=Saccostrea cuccullata TaxID=36930 RepID=UPI002ED5F3C3